MIWILVSTVGLLQALAAYYRWSGLSFFRGRTVLGYLFAAITIPCSYYWFFTTANRNTPGLEGWQLFSRFVLGALGGVLVVLVASSLLNASLPDCEQREQRPDEAGVDALRHDTYARLIAGAVARLTRQGER
jgi:hypothetical protein